MVHEPRSDAASASERQILYPAICGNILRARPTRSSFDSVSKNGPGLDNPQETVRSHGILRDYTLDSNLFTASFDSARIVVLLDEDRVRSDVKAAEKSERNSLSGKFRPARME